MNDVNFRISIFFLCVFAWSATAGFAQETGSDPAGASKTAAPARTETGFEAEFPTPYFLTPLAASPALLGLSSPRELVFLFTAPLLNRDRIEAVARRQEKFSRGVLRQRQNRIVRRVCGIPESRARQRLDLLRAEQGRQLKLWRATQTRFESMQQERIAELLPAYSQPEVLELRDTVRQLQLERQELVAEAWKEFFDELEDDLGDCEKPAEYEQIPSEHLHRPVFLARFYFFRKLPPRLRIKFTP